MRLSSIKPKKGTHDDLVISHVTVTLEDLDDLNERIFRLYTPVMVAGMQLAMGPDRIQPIPTAPKAPE